VPRIEEPRRREESRRDTVEGDGEEDLESRESACDRARKPAAGRLEGCSSDSRRGTGAGVGGG
jgi:hypothetical protein